MQKNQSILDKIFVLVVVLVDISSYEENIVRSSPTTAFMVRGGIAPSLSIYTDRT